jgi:hypothetical protein
MHFIVKSFRTLVEGRFVPLLAILAAAGMRLALFYAGDQPDAAVAPGGGYLWEPVAHLFHRPEVSLAASTLAVFLIAWILALLNSRFNLLRMRSNLAFVAPLFVLSLHPFFLTMSGDYISVIFVLSAFFPLLQSYQKPDSYLCSFRASILIAVASLFQIYALVLIPVWWSGERLMRVLRFRSLVSSLFGVFLVYVTLFSVYSLLNDLPAFVRPFRCFTSFSKPEIPLLSVEGWAKILLAALFFLSNITMSVRIYIRDKVLTLSLMRFVLFLAVFLLILHIVVYWKATFFFLLLAIVLTTYLSAYLFSKTTSKNHISFAYLMIALMTLFYASYLKSFLLQLAELFIVEN